MQITLGNIVSYTSDQEKNKEKTQGTEAKKAKCEQPRRGDYRLILIS